MTTKKKPKTHDALVGPVSATSRLAGHIRELRKSKGLTQAQLAEMLDVDFKTIHRIESGQGSKALDLAERIAVALGSTLQQVLK